MVLEGRDAAGKERAWLSEGLEEIGNITRLRKMPLLGGEGSRSRGDSFLETTSVPFVVDADGELEMEKVT
jgi:hypothetical protein